MPGKFVVKKGSTGKFRFNLLSTNGQVVASSEMYNSKPSCMNGIKAVRSLAADAVLEDQTTKEWAAADAAKKAAAATKKAAKKSAAKKAAAKKAAPAASG
ncbi:MAG: YegP family protein [Acidimicrobiales bacterium]